MAASWLETIKSKVQGYPAWTVDVGIFGIAGFFVGFILKNFGRMLLFAVCGLGAGLALLHYVHLITVNVAQIKEIFGLAGVNTIDAAVHVYAEWARAHVPGVMAAFFGCLLGWKVR